MTTPSRCAGPMSLGLTLLALLVTAPASAQDGEDMRALAERLRVDGAPILAADVSPNPASEAGAPPVGELARLQALAERAGSWTRELLVEDPDTTVVLSVGKTLPAGAVLETAARLERASVPSITLAQSIQGE